MHLLKYETGMSTPTFNSTKKCFGFFFNWEHFNEISHRFFLFLEKNSQLKCLILTEKTTHYALDEK